MKPYYSHNGQTIYCGNCRDILPSLLDNSVDLGITSPPFNLGNSHHTGNYRHQAYNDAMPEQDYQSNQTVILDRLYAITKNNGSLWYQHKNRIVGGLSISPYQWLFNTSWIIKQEIVWRNGSQNFDKIRFYPMTERLYWLAKDTNTTLSNIINKHDDWHIEPVGSSGTHTRAFPEEIVSNILACFPNANSIIDPYMGSGTTLRVAKNLRRECIGIEISEKYCEIAAKRLSQEVLL